MDELIDSAENLLAELGAAGSDGWATRSVHVDDIDRLRAAIVAVEVSGVIPTSIVSDGLDALRSAVKNLLPIGNGQLPGNRVIPIYVRMDELRALHALANPALSD